MKKLSYFVLSCAIILISWGQAFAQTSFDGRGGVTYPGGSIIPGYDSRTCGSGAPDGAIRYNSASTCVEYCDGASWVCPSGSGGKGYFVASNGAFNPNLGGLSGADSSCLTELQTYNWKGKADAGTLTGARVKAFLCDSATCNNLEPDTVYLFARSNNTTMGGTAFVTDANGAGPGYSDTWGGNGYFGTAAGTDFWTSRSAGTADRWGITPFGSNHCSNWSDATLSFNGRAGSSSNSGTNRWSNGAWMCSSTSIRLICFVNP